MLHDNDINLNLIFVLHPTKITTITTITTTTITTTTIKTDQKQCLSIAIHVCVCMGMRG